MSGIEPDKTAQPVNNANSDFLVSEDTLNIVTTDGQPDGAIDIIASARPTSVVSASAFVGGTSAGLGALTRDITVDITVEAEGSSVAASAEPALNDHTKPTPARRLAASSRPLRRAPKRPAPPWARRWALTASRRPTRPH